MRERGWGEREEEEGYKKAIFCRGRSACSCHGNRLGGRVVVGKAHQLVPGPGVG